MNGKSPFGAESLAAAGEEAFMILSLLVNGHFVTG